MRKEKSCGAVIYKYIDNELFILLLKHNLGHWSFAKGHVEDGETEQETAIREIKEETNLDVTINSDFRYVITYSPYEGVIKDVVYFLATTNSDNIKAQQSEISEIKWFKYEDAISMITYEDDRKVLMKAIEYLNK